MAQPGQIDSVRSALLRARPPDRLSTSPSAFLKQAHSTYPPPPPHQKVQTHCCPWSGCWKGAAAPSRLTAVLLLNLSMTKSRDRLWEERAWALGRVPLACPPTSPLKEAVTLQGFLSFSFLPVFHPFFVIPFAFQIKRNKSPNKPKNSHYIHFKGLLNFSFQDEVTWSEGQPTMISIMMSWGREQVSLRTTF